LTQANDQLRSGNHCRFSVVPADAISNPHVQSVCRTASPAGCLLRLTTVIIISITSGDRSISRCVIPQQTPSVAVFFFASDFLSYAAGGGAVFTTPMKMLCRQCDCCSRSAKYERSMRGSHSIRPPPDGLIAPPACCTDQTCSFHCALLNVACARVDHRAGGGAGGWGREAVGPSRRSTRFVKNIHTHARTHACAHAEPLHIVFGEGNTSPCWEPAGGAMECPRTQRTRCLVSTHRAPLDGRMTATAVRHQSLHFRYSLRQREERRRHSRRAVNYYCRRGARCSANESSSRPSSADQKSIRRSAGCLESGPGAGTGPAGRPSICGPRR
jgi:hypothetical protein